MKTIRLSLRTLEASDAAQVRQLAGILCETVRVFCTRFDKPGPQSAFACADAFLVIANELASAGKLTTEEATFLVSEVKRGLKRHAFRYGFTDKQRAVLECLAKKGGPTPIHTVVTETGLTVGVVHPIVLQFRRTGLLQMKLVTLEPGQRKHVRTAGYYWICDPEVYQLLGFTAPAALQGPGKPHLGLNGP